MEYLTAEQLSIVSKTGDATAQVMAAEIRELRRKISMMDTHSQIADRQYRESISSLESEVDRLRVADKRADTLLAVIASDSASRDRLRDLCAQKDARIEELQKIVADYFENGSRAPLLWLEEHLEDFIKNGYDTTGWAKESRGIIRRWLENK
jgi:ABC-type phosphate transport system auxiliary subunit